MSLGLREAQWKLADLIRANGSVEDLFKLAEEVSGNVAEATPEDTFLLQSGHLVDGAPAGTSTGTSISQTFTILAIAQSGSSLMAVNFGVR